MTRPDKWDAFKLKTVTGDDLVAALRSAYTEGERAGMERAAVSVRAACGACEGSGHAGDDAECEYCGRPMAAIRRANLMKQDASLDELKRFGEWAIKPSIR